MPNIGGYNEQYRQQSRYMNLRGAQLAQDKLGKETEFEEATKASGSKKQLIGTILGVAAVIVLLIIIQFILN